MTFGSWNYRTWVNDGGPAINAGNLQEHEDNISSNRAHRNTVGNPHNTKIEDLDDVTIISPVAEQFLYYNGTYWQNQYMMWRKNGNNIYFPHPLGAAGNVGIGTDTPGEKFEISGGNQKIWNTTPTLKLEHTTDSGIGGTINWLGAGASSKYKIRLNHDGNVLEFYDDVNDQLDFIISGHNAYFYGNIDAAGSISANSQPLYTAPSQPYWAKSGLMLWWSPSANKPSSNEMTWIKSVSGQPDQLCIYENGNWVNKAPELAMISGDNYLSHNDVMKWCAASGIDFTIQRPSGGIAWEWIEDPYGTKPVNNATKNQTIIQSSEPTIGNYPSGTIWIDSDDGCPYISDGSDWKRVTWSVIANDSNAPANNAQVNAPTIGARKNKRDFSVTYNGAIYLHGFDDNGNPSDIDGYITYNGQTITINRNQIATNYTILTSLNGKGYIVFDTAKRDKYDSTGSYTVDVVCAKKSGGTWYYDDADGNWKSFSPDGSDVVIGTYKRESGVITDCNVWGYGMSPDVVPEPNADVTAYNNQSWEWLIGNTKDDVYAWASSGFWVSSNVADLAFKSQLDDISDIANNLIREIHISRNAVTSSQILFSDISLDYIQDGTNYGRVKATNIDSNGIVMLDLCSGNIDHISTGATWGKVKLANITADGFVVLSYCSGSIDDIDDGDTYGRIAITDLGAGHLYLKNENGSYTVISGGFVKTDGIRADLIAANAISGGHILSDEIVSRHILANTISGGHIQANSIDASHIQALAISGGHIQAGEINTSHIRFDGTAPGSPQEGQLWYDDGTDHLKVQTGTGTQTIAYGADVTDTWLQNASTINFGGKMISNRSVTTDPGSTYMNQSYIFTVDTNTNHLYYCDFNQISYSDAGNGTDELYAQYGFAKGEVNCGNVEYLTGVGASADYYGGGVCANLIGMRVKDMDNTGTVGNFYGILVDAPTLGTVNSESYAIKIEDWSSADGAIKITGGDIVASSSDVYASNVVLNPNSSEPSKTAGTLWASGANGVLYYMSTNNGTWRRVNLT